MESLAGLDLHETNYMFAYIMGNNFFVSLWVAVRLYLFLCKGLTDVVTLESYYDYCTSLS